MKRSRLALKKYNTGFKIVGAAYEDSIVLLKALNEYKSWEKVKEIAFEENLLKKKSSKWIKKLLQYFQMRFIYDHKPLPSSKLLSRYVSIESSRSSVVQVLFQYVCETHTFVDKLVTGLIGGNVSKYGVFRLTKSDFMDFLENEAVSHPEINEWSNGTVSHFRDGFFAFLRSSDLMEKPPSFTIRKFVIQLESFAFFLFGLLDEGLAPFEIFKSHLWERYFLSQVEIEQLLSQCQVRGWLQFRSFGDIYELIPKYDSLGGWIDALE